MFATFRRIKTTPGSTEDVAQLILSEYVPLIEGEEGFVSYTLIDLGEDEVGSVGMFSSAESAERANSTAREWTADRLAPLIASPLEARSGVVLIHHDA